MEILTENSESIDLNKFYINIEDKSDSEQSINSEGGTLSSSSAPPEAEAGEEQRKSSAPPAAEAEEEQRESSAPPAAEAEEEQRESSAPPEVEDDSLAPPPPLSANPLKRLPALPAAEEKPNQSGGKFYELEFNKNLINK